MLKNAGPKLNLESDKMGHLVSWDNLILSFSSAKLAGKAIFSTFPVAPPIIILEISKISETIIGGATGKVLKMAFPANLAS